MRLPVYEQQVRLQGRNRTDLNVRANPNAFGAQIGAAVQDLAVGVGKVAEAKIYKANLVAEADAKAGLNEYIDINRDALYDPQTGALVQTGANGLTENRERAEATLAERRKAIEDKLGPQARKIFADAADRLDDNSADALIKHDASETRNYVNSQSQALTENFMAAAIDNYGDDAKWNEFMGAALGEIERTGALNGIPPEAIELKKREALGAAHGNRAIRIAFDDPAKADAYLDAHKDDLGEAEYTRLKTGMEAAVVEHKAEKVVEELRGSDGYVGARDTHEDTWLKYNYGDGTVRNKPLSNKMKASMSFLRDMGVTMEVFSGGETPEQKASDSGRHMHGAGADVYFYKDGRKLDWANPADLPIFNEIIQRAKAGGVVNFGAGEGYMGQGSMHLSVVGTPLVHGAKGKSANAPAWLQEMYNGTWSGGAIPANATGGGGADAGGAGAPRDTGMSTRSAYEAIMAIEDPKVRAAAMAKLDAQLKTEAALAATDQKAAADEAWKMYTQDGMAPESVPMDLQIKMGREATLNFFESARAYESGTLVTDELRYTELQRMAVEDPQGFAELDLNYERMNFSKGDFRAVEAMQLDLIQQMQKGEQDGRKALDDPAEMQKVYTAAEQVYKDAVPTSGSKQTPQEAAAYRRFQEQVKDYSRQFMTEKGRLMTFDEQDRLFSMLLTPVVIENNSGLFGSKRETMLFDAPFREPGERVRGNVSPGDIALVDEEEARTELRDFFGREPTEDEIATHHNRKLLADMGITPEMEYQEIPRDVRRKLVDRYPDASDEELVDLYVDFVLETTKRQ